ncbi:uncharacterized protein LOC119588873 [Penaeus monodon]|uniref:uncharacterized protein LOC119588873 n=1 Tax=Penaeus monodon TaxID=6687 RepID=UPI0018A79857|nr:uncharacterized protein LOC119588873 [Penaeus monodon]
MAHCMIILSHPVCEVVGFYEALKAVYGPTHHVQSPLRSADGQALFTDKTSILSRWSEHFQALFSADRVVQDSAVLRIRQKPVIEELDELPSIEEISKAIEQLKCGKAAGVDGIPPEIWKDGGPTLHSKLHELLVCCWEQSKLPRDLHAKIDREVDNRLAKANSAFGRLYKRAVSSFEDSRRSNLKEKRRMKKDREASAAVPDQTFDCSRCGRTCLSRIGLDTSEVVGMIRQGDKIGVLIYLRKGGDPNARNQLGMNLLHVACLEGQEEVVEVLLDAGAKVNSCTTDMCTPLHRACIYGYKGIVELLLSKNAYINAQSVSLNAIILKYPNGLSVKYEGNMRYAVEYMRISSPSV